MAWKEASVDAVDTSLAERGTGPVFDRRIFTALRSITMREMLNEAEWNPHLKDEFVQLYTSWLSGSTVAPVLGLEQFPIRYFVNGVTQAYDIFFYEHKGRRFRTLRGEYPYARLSVANWAHLEDDELRDNDALLLSYPFYGDGARPRDYPALMDRCQELGVPVFVDAAYFGTCYDVTFDYSHSAIDLLAFSLSKPFSVQSQRAGIMYSKRKLGYLEEIQIAARYFNKVGAYVGMKLMRQFPADFMPTMHRDAHRRVCEQLDLIPTNCIMLANVADDDTRFDRVLADDRFEDQQLPAGTLRRICVSNYLGYRGSPLRRVAKRLLRR